MVDSFRWDFGLRRFVAFGSGIMPLYAYQKYFVNREMTLDL